MSTYVLMRILESSPRRYERGIRLLTLGRLDRAYDRLASHIERGQRVLDLGCGTGALTLRAARRGARAKGIDRSAEMLEIARERVEKAGLASSVELVEMGVAELDAEDAGGYDAVTSGLCFSELSDDEIRYALKQAARVLRPGGLLLIADEVEPPGVVSRWVHASLRAPFVLLTYVATQRTSHPVPDLERELEAAGFTIVSVRRSALGSFGEFVARRPAGSPS